MKMVDINIQLYVDPGTVQAASQSYLKFCGVKKHRNKSVG